MTRCEDFQLKGKLYIWTIQSFFNFSMVWFNIKWVLSKYAWYVLGGSLQESKTKHVYPKNFELEIEEIKN